MMNKNIIPKFEIYKNTTIAIGDDSKRIMKYRLALDLRNAESIDDILGVLIKINELEDK